jgi:hypothetical protein
MVRRAWDYRILGQTAWNDFQGNASYVTQYM